MVFFYLNTTYYLDNSSPTYSLQRQLVVINYKLVLMHLISRYRYLSALISQSFLDIGSVSRILDGIMKLCLQFCWSIENQDSSSDPSELEHLTEV